MPAMVEEVSKALSWTFDHIPAVGGDATKVRPLAAAAAAAAAMQQSRSARAEAAMLLRLCTAHAQRKQKECSLLACTLSASYLLWLLSTRVSELALRAWVQLLLALLARRMLAIPGPGPAQLVLEGTPCPA